MSVLHVKNLGLAYGARDVFSSISFDLPADARVGLVGANGVGKTSLFRVLAGLREPSEGTVRLSRGTRIGYLRQEAVEAFAGHDHTVYDEMQTAFAHLHDREERLRRLEERMAAGDAAQDVLDAYGAEQEAFARLGGYDHDVRIRQVLDGLGFDRPQWSTRMSHLSGGQKTRALLARLLLEQPTLLILDEPTNHLDIDAIEWLERTLYAWPGALLIASHDRYFLDRVVNRVWEMTSQHLEMYTGNYTAYTRQRQERWERNRVVFERETERLRHELELVRQYIAWRKFDEAWGKLKILSRELMAIEAHGLLGIQGKSWSDMGIHKARMMTIDEAHDAIKRIRPPARPASLAMRLTQSRRSGQIVLRTENLEVGYEGEALFRADDIVLDRQERVALIGPNGAGKTTFLRTLLGQLPPVSGDVTLGLNVTLGYFAQAHDSLERDRTVLDELLRHRNVPIPEARDHLARYLFRGDDVFKRVGLLSGGERARLALAILALEGVNVLLLDEPTNHLDVPAREVLQEGLEGFEGTLIMVSHDRYLVSQLATQIWDLRDGHLHVFRGSYEDFERARDARTAEATERAASDRKDRAQAHRSDRDERRRAQSVARLEERIEEAEAALAECTRLLAECGDGTEPDELLRLTERYGSAERDLQQLMEQWTEMAAPVV